MVSSQYLVINDLLSIVALFAFINYISMFQIIDLCEETAQVRINEFGSLSSYCVVRKDTEIMSDLKVG